MKRIDIGKLMGGLGILLFLAACQQATPEEAPLPSPTEPEAATEPAPVTGSVTVGGRLYDKWWVEADVQEPTEDHPLWSTQSTNTRSGADTWRCKECHGWDYLGEQGAYSSGSHFTGFSGVRESSEQLTLPELVASLDGTRIPDHNFSNMGEEALGSLAVFLNEGLMDMGMYIDSEDKSAIGGDTGHGQDLYDQTCTACHGADGRMLNFHDPEEPEYVGTIAQDNPWEFIHKVRVGQPGSNPPMPAAIDSGWSVQDAVDVLAYAQTLPTTPPVAGSVSRGGRLYDKWWSEAALDAPEADNPVWSRQETNTRSGDDTWRCKECHGWDYMGAEGAYGSGSHFTGFPGIFDAQAMDTDQILAQLTGELDPEHDFSVLDEASLTDLVSFIREGLLDVRPFIDAETKAAVGGDAGHGEELYASACAICHGEDGTEINFHDPEEPEYVGTIALDNPWEFIHKVRAGQPGSDPAMPSALDSGWSIQDVIDVLTFAQTLPTEAP